jgi:spectinomycin phosphotransferase
MDELWLAEMVADGWRVSIASVEYVPEGGGSHHWIAVDRVGNRHFITVDDLDDKDWLGDSRDAVFQGLARAFDTANALRHVVGLEFVIAPVPDSEGEFLRRLNPRFGLSVFPFLAARSFAFGPYTDPTLRDHALDLIIALHKATSLVRHRAPRHVPGYSARTTLKEFLAEPDRPWDAGPFSESAHDLLAEHIGEIVRLVEGYELLVARTAPARMHPVITHGEPHPANLLAIDGRLALIDWDTTALAPPERDLSLLISDSGAGCERYEQATGRRVHLPVIALYRLRWYLDDLASATRLFSRSHSDTPDTRKWWEGLSPWLQQLPSRLELLGQALRAAA